MKVSTREGVRKRETERGIDWKRDVGGEDRGEDREEAGRERDREKGREKRKRVLPLSLNRTQRADSNGSVYLQ